MNRDAREAILSRARFGAQHEAESQWVFAHKDGKRVQDAKRSFATACRRVGVERFLIHDMGPGRCRRARR